MDDTLAAAASAEWLTGTWRTLQNALTRNHIYIYIYIYMCVCVCVGVCVSIQLGRHINGHQCVTALFASWEIKENMIAAKLRWYIFKERQIARTDICVAMSAHRNGGSLRVWSPFRGTIRHSNTVTVYILLLISVCSHTEQVWSQVDPDP